MATTVASAFEEFASNLEITDRQTKLVSERRENVVKCLSAQLSVTNSLLIGSYARDTMIRYLSEADVDVLVVLHYGNHQEWDNPEGTVKALDKFRAILSDCYKTTAMRRDRNCITMKFSEFRLDVVPAFAWETGGYSIPDSIRKTWLRTDPIAFASKMTDLNKQHNRMIKPLIKMLKAWNRNVRWPIGSFHLECLVYQQLYGAWPISDYPKAVKSFFDWASSDLWSHCTEPVYGEVVDYYLDEGSTWPSKRQQVIEKVKAAATLAEEAYNDGPKYPSIAIREWKELFGEFFPSYG